MGYCPNCFASIPPDKASAMRGRIRRTDIVPQNPNTAVRCNFCCAPFSLC